MRSLWARIRGTRAATIFVVAAVLMSLSSITVTAYEVGRLNSTRNEQAVIRQDVSAEQDARLKAAEQRVKDLAASDAKLAAQVRANRQLILFLTDFIKTRPDLFEGVEIPPVIERALRDTPVAASGTRPKPSSGSTGTGTRPKPTVTSPTPRNPNPTTPGPSNPGPSNPGPSNPGPTTPSPTTPNPTPVPPVVVVPPIPPVTPNPTPIPPIIGPGLDPIVGPIIGPVSPIVCNTSPLLCGLLGQSK